MKINLFYNDYIKEIEIDISKKIGIIQEKLLNYCSLLIYNIEYTEIIVENKSYILGDNDFDFNEIFETILIKLCKETINIEKIIMYDRKRDFNGNVFKNNIIIDKYNKWYIQHENENYFNYYVNEQSENRHIIRFPIETILQNILRVPINNISYENIFNEQEQNNDQEQNSEQEQNSDQEHNNQEQNNQQENNQQEINHNIFINNTYIPFNNSTNIFNNFIDIFDRYLNDENIDNDYNDLPDLVPIDENFYEDVKTILSDEEFNNIETLLYKDLNNNEKMECLICTEEFIEKDNIKKIKCNHLFHTECIKQWLCKESNKCPICRIEIDKGYHK